MPEVDVAPNSRPSDHRQHSSGGREKAQAAARIDTLCRQTVKESSHGRLRSMLRIGIAMTASGPTTRLCFAVFSPPPGLTSVDFRPQQIYRAGLERTVLRLLPLRATLSSWSP